MTTKVNTVTRIIEIAQSMNNLQMAISDYRQIKHVCHTISFFGCQEKHLVLQNNIKTVE